MPQSAEQVHDGVEKSFENFVETFEKSILSALNELHINTNEQIAVALSHHAKLLVMDEPTSGLDPIVRNEMINIFRDFVVEEDHTILLSSHITGDLEKIADEVVFIDGGKIVLAGNKDEILEKHAILKCKKDEVALISKSLIVGMEQSSFGAEILVNDRNAAEKLYPEMVLESAALEEIMIYYVNSKRGE